MLKRICQSNKPFTENWNVTEKCGNSIEYHTSTHNIIQFAVIKSNNVEMIDNRIHM